MLGERWHIVTIKPLANGVISDFEVTEQMLKHFSKRSTVILLCSTLGLVVIGIPSGVTEVEKRAVEEAARNAGAREVMLVEEPVAALGARLPTGGARQYDCRYWWWYHRGGCYIFGRFCSGRSLRVAGEN